MRVTCGCRRASKRTVPPLGGARHGAGPWRILHFFTSSSDSSLFPLHRAAPSSSLLGVLFLQVRTHLREGAAYHVAKKKIPSKDGPVAGIKLELFIFDTFPLASPHKVRRGEGVVKLFLNRLPPKVALMEVDRAAEFAPVKNAPGEIHHFDDPDRLLCMPLVLRRSLSPFQGRRLTLLTARWRPCWPCTPPGSRRPGPRWQRACRCVSGKDELSSFLTPSPCAGRGG